MKQNKRSNLTDKIKELADKKPKRLIFYMLAVAFINFGLLMYIALKNNDSPTLTDTLHKSKMAMGQSEENSFSIGNYMTVKRLQDTLQALMAKGKLDRDDTLTFVRVYQQFSQIDPTITEDFEKANQVLEEKKQAYLQKFQDSINAIKADH